MLQVEAGSTGKCGGDSGHGCRIYFRIEDVASTDMTINKIADRFGFVSGNCHKNRITWLTSKCKKPKYKFTQFEYDLINTYRHVDDRCKFNGCYQLKSLKEKGYFKNVDKNELIKDIIENCEVI